jgi:uncharacterized protein YjbI with pentapeptide repeats
MNIDNLKQTSAEMGTNSNNHHSLFEKLRKGELIKSATIPAEEIKRLVKEPQRIVRAPIIIKDSIIKGNLDLQYTTFKYGLSITNSVFEGSVNLSFSRFERSVDFSNSRFEGRADFRAAHAMFDFEIDLASFPQETSFEDLHVDEIFRAQGAQFNSVNFERIQVAKSVLFCPSHSSSPQRTHFCGAVNFSDANIQGPVHFEGADFQNQAVFDRVCFGSVAIFKCYQHNDQVHRTISETDRAACSKFNHQTLSFIRTRFGGPVSFIGAKIQGDTAFDGAWFNDEANFEHVKINGDMNFQQLKLEDSPRIVSVNFWGAARFHGAQIRGNACFSGAQFKKKADFAQVNIGGGAYFYPARNKNQLLPVRFNDEALFHNTRIQQTAVFQGAQFKKIAVFDRLQTGGGLYFNSSQLNVGFLKESAARREKRRRAEDSFIRVCGGQGQSPECDLKRETSGQPPAVESRKIVALPPTSKLNLIEPWLDAELSDIFCPVRFSGMASLLDMRIEGTVDFRGAQFETTALFERLYAAGGIFFRAIDYGNPDNLPNRLKYPIRICPVKFGGNVSFVGAWVGGAAEFDGALFMGDKEASASFERIKIEGNTYFRPFYAYTSPVTFRIKVNFSGAYIKGDAEFSGAQFNKDTDFKGMRIDGNAYFDARHHEEDNAPLTGHECNHVSFRGLADLSGINFKNEAYFDNTRFHKKAVFMGAEINGMVSFNEAVFIQETIFNEARFSLLSFFEDQGEVDQPKNLFFDIFNNPSEMFRKFLDNLKAKKEKESAQFKDAVDMRGTKYEIIKVNLVELTKGLTKSKKYDLQPYTHLERVLRAAGNDHDADYVYLERRHRERRNLYKRSGDFIYLIRFVLDWFYWKISNYGVHPIKLVFYSLLIIALGSAIFTLPGAVEPKEEELVTIQRQIKSLTHGQAETFRAEHPATTTEEDPMNPVYKQESLGLTQAIGVSLSQFIPIVEIPSGSRWKPSEKPILCWSGHCISYALYGSFHRLLGALFVPLGVAALAVMLYRHAKLIHEASE